MQATFVYRARRRAMSVFAALAVTATCGLTLSQTTHAYAAGPSASGTPIASPAPATSTAPATPNPQSGSQDPAAVIAAKYAELGGPAGVLGAATSGVGCSAPSGLCQQSFEHGVITWNERDGVAHVIKGAIYGRWNQRGVGIVGLGYPAADEDCSQVPGSCVQYFPTEGAYAVWVPGHPAVIVANPIYDLWVAHGAARGQLGYPTEDTITVGDDSHQQFAGGILYHHRAAGGYRDTIVKGAFFHLIRTMPDSERTRLGAPADEQCNLPGGGCLQSFMGGTLYWSPDTGAHVVWGGKIYDRYMQMGGERSVLGYPTGPEVCGLKDGGCYQLFQGGAIVWSPNSGAWESEGSIRYQWAQMGAENGSLGYPTGPVEIVNGRWHQSYQHGELWG